MNITDIRVFLRDEDQLKGYVNITIDDAFVVKNIKIIEGKNGLFVAMPSYKMKNGEFRDVAHPINSETRSQIETMVLEKYKEACESE